MTDNRTKKLHIVHTEASLGWGGQEIRILTEAQGMLERGHRVTLLCPPEARIHAAARERGLPVEALPIGRKRPGGVLALRRWLNANPADVINTHSSTDTWLAALACRLLRSPPPLVRTRHVSAPIPNNFPTRWLYGVATRHIVTTGGALRRQLIEENGFDADRITSVPTGIATNHFVPGDQTAARARLGLPQGAPLIGIVATLRSWKGHRFLIEAFERLRDARARLVIVGGGPQREALDTQVASLGLADRVRLVGDQADVLPWFQSLDVFALPSYANEGVPQAILQAMICGVPCVTTTTGSIEEVARDGETALIVKAEDVHDLRRGLERLLGDPALRTRLGASARAHCAANCSIGKMLERMEQVFIDAVGARASSDPEARMLTMDDIARAAARDLDGYRARVARVPYERKGILYSEMFFFQVCVSHARPRRILESGRARGQSTLLLAVVFPELPVISIEHDPDSPDVPVAQERLRSCRNVELRFGDATRLLPALAQAGDVALIDGPKGFRGLRLALRLLAEGRARMIFLHDVGRDTPERRFLEKYLPGTLYSDDPRFARIAHVLDAAASGDIPLGHQWETGGAPLGYGYTLACLQWNPRVSYRRLRWAAMVAGLSRRVGS